jgi:regulator of sigma E protease
VVIRDLERGAGKRFDSKRAERLELDWKRPQPANEETSGFLPAELYVEGVKPGSPAEEAGLASGDRIISVIGTPITTWGELEQSLLSAKDQRGPIQVKRRNAEGVLATLSVTLALSEAEVAGPLRSSRKVMDHGIIRTFWHAAPKVETRKMSLPAAVVLATNRCVEIIVTMAEGLRRIMVGRVSLKQIGGPVMLYDIAAEVAKTNDAFWHWFSLLSLNLGLMNLLPVPVLDGGLILLSLVEILRRRPLTVAIREKANYVGLVLVLALMVTAVVNDLLRVFS